MKNKKFRSISTKLIFLLSLSAMIALLFSSIGIFIYTFNAKKADDVQSLSQITQIMGQNLIATIEFDDSDSAKGILKALELNKNIDGAFIFKDKDTVFSSYLSTKATKDEMMEVVHKVYETKTIKTVVEYIDLKHIVISRPIYFEQNYLGTFCIVSNTDNLKEIIIEQFSVLLLVSIISLMVVAILASRLQKIFTTPIFTLKDAMEDVTKNANYSSHVNSNSSDEFGILFDGFNNMLSKIKEQNSRLEEHTKTLNETIKIKTRDIEKQKNDLESLVESFDKNVIFSRTDLQGIITHVSEAFCEISGYREEELLGKPHNIIRHPDMQSSVFKEIWDSLKEEKCIEVDVKNLKRDGSFYWVNSKFEPMYNGDNIHIGYSALRVDITSKKEVEELSQNLEKKVKIQTENLSKQLKILKTAGKKQSELIKEVNKQKKQIESILENILLPVIITSKETRKVLYINSFAEEKYELVASEFKNRNIDFLYTYESQKDEILDVLTKNGFIQNLEQRYKTMSGKEFDGLLSLIPIEYDEQEAYIGMVTDITEQKEREKEIKEIHKHTRESIEYASLIQGALVPDNNVFRKYFQEYFVIWHPKDTVGGDIYLFEELRDKDECLLMVIDCTGHGVPGAFVTMLVKAIERQIVAKINHSDEIVNPAKILSIFNTSMKHLLKQENRDSVSNAGFDGQVMYYNKKDKIVKFASARNELFYYQDDELHIIKGDRHSVGYKDSDSSYEFKEHTIDVSKDTSLYLATDGYWDQNGGEKSLPFGKKRLKKLLSEIYKESMSDQQEEFIYTLHEYENGSERNDDVTLIGLKIKNKDDNA